MTNGEYRKLKRRVDKFFGRRVEEAEADELMGEIVERFNPGFLSQAHRFDRRAPFIYFIQVGDDGPIKIGYSGNPYRRLGQLQTGHPELLRILLMFPGEKEDELWLHQILKNFRIGGEWFVNHAALQELIAKLNAVFYPEGEA
jgi:hypothetical protein